MSAHAWAADVVAIKEGSTPVPTDPDQLGRILRDAERIGQLWVLYVWQRLVEQCGGDQDRARLVWDAARTRSGGVADTPCDLAPLRSIVR